MKHSGNVSDFIAHRDQEVYKVYKEILRSGNYPRRALDLYSQVAAQPASRLWVNEYRAAAVIGALRRERKRRLIREKADSALLHPTPESDRAKAKRAMMQKRITDGTVTDLPSCLEKMYTEKRRMYELIYGRVEKIMEKDPGKTLIEAVSEAVLTPADHFYLSPKTIGAIILRMRRQPHVR